MLTPYITITIPLIQYITIEETFPVFTSPSVYLWDFIRFLSQFYHTLENLFFGQGELCVLPWCVAESPPGQHIVHYLQLLSYNYILSECMSLFVCRRLFFWAVAKKMFLLKFLWGNKLVDCQLHFWNFHPSVEFPHWGGGVKSGISWCGDCNPRLRWILGWKRLRGEDKMR